MSVRKDEDSVAVADSGEAVSDNDTGAAHGVQGVGHLPLCFIVQRAGGFVNDQQLPFPGRPRGAFRVTCLHQAGSGSEANPT